MQKLLFQSYTFILIFLPLVIALYCALAKQCAAREWMLIAASGVFYAWWDVRFLPLMFGQAAISWFFIRFFPHRHFMVWLVVVANIGLLGVFKYLDFALGTLNALVPWSLPRGNLVLPIGISFYTFHIASYVLDFRKGRAPLYSFRRFMLYVVYFPQLVAGPITRHWEILPQLNKDPLRPGVWDRVYRGGILFVIGLNKKLLLADALAPMADRVFTGSATQVPNLGQAWAGALAFTFQLYFDFSAYSDMAIGVAMMMGLRLPDNFGSPYRSQNIQEFWRRWHMTLSRFFRDYLYIPMGGSREGIQRYVIATLTTFALCGLWHGAGWTFVLWGLMHGLGLIGYHMFGKLNITLPRTLSWLLTFIFVVFGWVLFRSLDFSMARSMLAGMLGFGGPGVSGGYGFLGLCLAIVLIPPRAIEIASGRIAHSLWYPAAASALFAFLLLEIARDAPKPFIYFQF